ncbi:MAG: terminase [Pseudoxanthomonas spadix]|nr:MAG: terminase [Pseudoxanthomonas spadix]
MPPPSKIDTLPPEVREELDRLIVAAGFGNYTELADWLRGKGHDVGKSTVALRGQRLKRRLASISATTEAMKLVSAAAPDEFDESSGSIIRLVQTDMFEALVEFQDAAAQDSEEISAAQRIALYSKAAKSIAEIVRAAISRNKFAAELREQARAELLREQEQKLEAAVQARGMTADQAAFWREQFLKGQ